MTVKATIDGLIHLQRINDRLVEIEGKRKELEGAILNVRDPLTRLETRRDLLITRVSELRAEMHRMELTVQENRDKIHKSQEKLPLITTQKEYFALKKEIEGMEREKDGLEEKLLQDMETFEELQKERDEVVSECEEEEKAFHEKKETMASENSHYDTEYKTLTAEKESICYEIDPEHLENYKKVLIYKGAPAVVQIVAGNCQGCFMNLPPQLYNDVRKGESVITCSFCNRILYVEG
jgi:predicted  nucleic acid-binding Zn-ribbon protein